MKKMKKRKIAKKIELKDPNRKIKKRIMTREERSLRFWIFLIILFLISYIFFANFMF